MQMLSYTHAVYNWTFKMKILGIGLQDWKGLQVQNLMNTEFKPNFFGRCDSGKYHFCFCYTDPQFVRSLITRKNL